ncbi:MAG: hypothetical protein LUD15_06165 [Bacteroides sp.]|nr:hypothetical protein [Bacteroides sp.]
MLINNIDELVAGEKKLRDAENLVLTDVSKQYETVNLNRGNMARVFVYIKKSDIIPVYNADNMIILETEPQEQQPQENTFVTEVIPISAPVQEEHTEEKQIIPVIENKTLQEILILTTFKEIQPYFTRLKNEGKITFGKYSEMTSPESCYLLVYDKEEKIVAILDKGGNIRTNLRTGAPDGTHNYKGCGAFWFRVDE